MDIQETIDNTHKKINFICELKERTPLSIADKVIQFILKPDINPFNVLESEYASMCFDCVSMEHLHDIINHCEDEDRIEFVRTHSLTSQLHDYKIILNPHGDYSFSDSLKDAPSHIDSIEKLDQQRWDIYKFLEQAESQ